MVFLISVSAASGPAIAGCGSYKVETSEMRRMARSQSVACACDAEQVLAESVQINTTADGGVYLYDPLPLDLLRMNIARAKSELKERHSISAHITRVFPQ